MKTSLTTFFVFLACTLVYGADTTPPKPTGSPQPKAPAIKTETREFRPDELHDIRLNMEVGGLSFTVGKTTYTYSPNYFQQRQETIAASATLLSELRHATKLFVKVPLPVGEQADIWDIVLQFDSLK